jgi:hypothetical protein
VGRSLDNTGGPRSITEARRKSFPAAQVRAMNEYRARLWNAPGQREKIGRPVTAQPGPAASTALLRH